VWLNFTDYVSVMCNIYINICMYECYSGEGVRSVYFMDNGCGGREKIIKKTNGNLSRKGGSGEEHENNGIWVQRGYDCPNFGQIKISRADGV